MNENIVIRMAITHNEINIYIIFDTWKYVHKSLKPEVDKLEYPLNKLWWISIMTR